jgi:hypothetical protein
MRDHEAMMNAKLAAAQQGDCAKGQAQGVTGGIAGAKAYYGDCEKQVPLRETLRHRLHRTDYERDTLSRAAQILDAHPEFEDLIWLIRSGLV